MKRKLFLNFSFFLILFNLLINRGVCQEIDPSIYRIMFYNVENLFDIYKDSITDDKEFTSGGLRRWNFTRYNGKINSIYKAIIAAGDWDPPMIVAFCEIENRKVLEDLIYRTNLSRFNYGIIHHDSPDRRGIDVCLIYRKKLTQVISFKYWSPVMPANKVFNSRSVLCATFLIEKDTVNLIVNHWPSRRGGVLASEDYRQEVERMVSEKTDSIILNSKGRSKIIISGDFNCTPDDQAIKTLIEKTGSGRALENLSEINYHKSAGTYKYMGRWEMIDQVIVSRKLLQSENGVYTSPDLLQIFQPDFLLKKDPGYPGMTPYATYSGYKYQGGYSDHLPVILDLKVR
jgi:exonuclease III